MSWNSYNSNGEHSYNIVTVNAEGEGTATITVTAGDKTATCKVTVYGQPEVVNGSAGLEYTLNYDGYYYLSGIGECKETNITVANYYEGKRVVGINSSALMNCTSVTGIIIPAGITQIYSRAFYGCTALESVTIGRNVTRIGDSVFFSCNSLSSINIDTLEHWCTIRFEGNAIPAGFGTPGDYEICVGGQKLEGDITVPGGVTAIAGGLFTNCNGITSVTLPDSVRSIGDYAFYNCKNLTRINLPDGLIHIGSSVFSNCTNLSDVTLPESIENIGAHAFKNCTSFTSITVPAKMTNITNNVFSGCTNLASVTFLGDVEGIGGEAFRDCVNLSGINLPDSLTYIGEWAFCGCTSLSGVNIPDGVKYIGRSAFEACIKITSITVPGSVDTIHDEAFSGCIMLSSVTICEGVGSIGERAFSGCEGLTEITIPSSVTQIGRYAFGWCDNLSSVTIEEGVVSIGEEAFYGCSFTNIVIPASVTSIGAGAFRNCANISSITVPFVGSAKEDAEYQNFGYIFGGGYSFNSEIPESLKTVIVTGGKIGENAFGYCKNIVSITLSEGVQSVADTAFDHCPSLTEIIIPDGLDVSNVNLEGSDNFKGTLVGNFYLFGTKLLALKEQTASVIIPSNITVIGAKAFNNGANIKYIYVPSGVKRAESGAFDGFTGYLFVGNYMLDGLDNNYECTVEYSIGDCTSDGWIYKSKSDGIQIIAYIGVGGEVAVPAQIDGDDVIEIGDGSTAFRTFLQRDDITKITFTSTKFSVNEWAIASCVNLKEIVIGADVTSFNIPPKAINGCTGLTAITLEGGYENYQVYFQSMAGVSGPYTIADGADLLNKVQSLPNGSVCMIMKKDVLSR